MDAMTSSEDHTTGRDSAIAESVEIFRSFLFALRFIIHDTARDPTFFDNHLLSYVSQDYIQAAVGLPTLISDGVHNVCRRELRFLLEMSIKLCFVQEHQYNLDVTSKLQTFEKMFDSTNISIQRQLKLYLLPSEEHTSFYEEVGRLYGATSKYVHLSQAQVLERINLVDQGRTSGHESAADVQELNKLLRRVLACCIVFLLHSVPPYVVGDLLVEPDGSSLRWYFSGSKFIALIDQQYDYKHERQANLSQIRTDRWNAVTF